MKSKSWMMTVLACCVSFGCDAPEADVCERALESLAQCGMVPEDSPFGSCEAEQYEQARAIVDSHAQGGCSVLRDAKSDGFLCRDPNWFLCVEHSVAELKPFRTDGCSMFPDGPPSDRTRWQHCCIELDIAYYIGGSSDARKAADRALADCVADTCSASLGELMYAGVRLGGTPALDVPMRWGYGWKYDPLNGYREPSPEELAAAHAQVQAYRSAPVPPRAFEQRLQDLLDAVTSILGLSDLIEEVHQESVLCEH